MDTLLFKLGIIVLSLHYESSFILDKEVPSVNPPAPSSLSSSSSSSPSSTETTETNTSTIQTPTTADTYEEDFDERLERSKNARLLLLQRYMLDTLGWDRPPAIDHETKMRILAGIQTQVYVSRQRHCHYPTCDLPLVDFPDYINRSLWFDTSSKSIRYYFHVSVDTNTDVEITSAIVRLHLKQREDCPCASDVDRSTSRIHIKIYQYRKPNRSHTRLRQNNMRLIDAKMVTWDSARWVSLQVTDAVKRNMSRGRRNGGFEVYLLDMEENIVDAKTVIDPTVCSTHMDYDCSNEHLESGNEPDEHVELNFSPRLEITTTVTSRIEILEREHQQFDLTT